MITMSLMRFFVLFLSFTCYSSALYFHIGETEKKCFIEDIPDETLVVGEVVRRLSCKHLAGVIRSGRVTDRIPLLSKITNNDGYPV